MTYIIPEDDIAVLPLSVRSLNALRRANIMTVGSLLEYPVDELANIRNLGSKSIDGILSLIENLKVSLGEHALISSPETMEGDRSCLESNFQIYTDDPPVENLGLSVRSTNCLRNAGIMQFSQLSSITEEKLFAIRGMGKKSVDEILQKIQYIRDNPIIQPAAPETTSIEIFTEKDKDIAQELSVLYHQSPETWLKEILEVKTNYPDVQAETFIYRLYEHECVHTAAKFFILSQIESHGELSKNILIEKMPKHLSNTTITDELLLELEQEKNITIGEAMLQRQYPSFMEYIEKIEDKRLQKLLRERITGKTLNEVGSVLDGITRERVRQLEQNALRRKPITKEDKYIYLYDNYDFSFEDFSLAYREPPETYHYLEMRCKVKRCNRKPIEEILTDTNISPLLRKQAEHAVYKQYITLNGVRIKKTSADLSKYYIKTYCKELTKFDDFVEQYHQFIYSLDLDNPSELSIESRYYNNRLNSANYVLWSQWSSFRYYNISEYDFEDLLSTLNLEQYNDIEFSTLKLFRDHPKLMRQYDVRDEYELHNLLKKIYSNKNTPLQFKKMPTLVVGNGNTDSQVYSLLLQYSPISAYDLAAKYEQEYGVKASTAIGSLFHCIEAYLYKGQYSIDYSIMPPLQQQRMAEILSNDFYLIKEVQRLYLREYPGADISIINAYNLKLLGFHVYPGSSGYIIKNTYGGATEFFNKCLTVNDIVDMKDEISLYRYLSTYNSELSRLKNEYEIIEFSPLRYINIRKLNQSGITKQHIIHYAVEIADSVEVGTYFTIKSLRENGFVHELDDLGFDEWFYSSILAQHPSLFSHIRVGGTRIFIKGKSKAEFTSMLTQIVEQHRYIDIYDLTDLLDGHYGVKMPKDKVVEFIRSTDLYYDTIMETVYMDYDTYFEEI